MILSNLISVGALALAADAFLVPFGSDAGKSGEDLSIYESPKEVSIDCSSCPYALKAGEDGHREWKHDVPSDLDMVFDVKSNVVTFNGVPIFPITNPGPIPLLTVTQRAKAGSEDAGEPQQLKISYSLEAIPKPANDGNTLITLTVGPMALENEMIRVDDLEVKIIRDATGKIIIHSVDAVTPAASSAEAQCKNVLCRVFARFMTSLAKVKAAAKNGIKAAKGHCSRCLRCMLRLIGIKAKHHGHANHGHGAPHRRPDGSVELPTHIVTRPGHPNGNKHVRPQQIVATNHKGAYGRLAHVFAAIKMVLIPTLIGLAFGMAASAIGMLVGQFVVFLWMRHRRQDDTVLYERLNRMDLDVKQEIPPPYEDAPIIEEAINEKDIEAKA